MACTHASIVAWMRFLLAVLVLAFTASPLAADARRAALTARGLAFTPDAFVERAAAGDLEAVKMYLEAGMNVNVVPHTRHNQRPALYEAAASGQAAMVKFLIARGADVTFKDQQDQTPLMAAAIAGQAEIVELLAAEGADVNAKGGYEQTPLIYAATFGHVEVVRVLLKLGADPKARDGMSGNTALERASHPEIVQMLKAAMGR